MSGGEGSIVQFDNVGLRYGTEREVLSDVSFTLHPGQLLLPHRRQRRGQDLAAQAAVSRAAPVARGHPHVRRPTWSPLPRDQPAGVPAARSAWCSRISAWCRTCRRSTTSRCRCAARACPKARSPRRWRDMLDWVGLDQRADARPGDAVRRRAAARRAIARARDRPAGNRSWPTSRPATSIPRWR